MKYTKDKKQIQFSYNDKIGKYNEYKNLDTFHNAVWPVFLIAQCFGIMPLVGITNSDPNLIKFRTKSIPMLITIVFLIFGSFLALQYLCIILPLGLDAKNLVNFFFFLVGLSGCIFFCFLARRWPALITEWTKVDLIFLMKPYEIPKRTLATRIRFFAFIIILMSLVEHMMFQFSIIYGFEKYVHTCNTTFTFSYKDYLLRNFRHAFQLAPYSEFNSIIFLYINWSYTFIWNYLDLFIITVSFGLSIRFEQMNMRIAKLQHKDAPEEVWSEIREHYVKLCELVENVDENISAIILLSCSNNLYFICFQLLNVFNKLRYTINYLYFWFSLLYLVIRTICLFLCAASINDKSKLPLKVLHLIPSRNWFIEVERLTSIITTKSVALSGSNFFFITKKLLFSMAGTIITYELVLLQFDEKDRKILPDLCGPTKNTK